MKEKIIRLIAPLLSIIGGYWITSLFVEYAYDWHILAAAFIMGMGGLFYGVMG